MNTLQRLAMIDDILAHAPPEMIQDWAGAWLEELEDRDLRAVRRAFVPDTAAATADPGLPHILAEDIAP